VALFTPDINALFTECIGNHRRDGSQTIKHVNLASDDSTTHFIYSYNNTIVV